MENNQLELVSLMFSHKIKSGTNEYTLLIKGLLKDDDERVVTLEKSDQEFIVTTTIGADHNPQMYNTPQEVLDYISPLIANYTIKKLYIEGNLGQPNGPDMTESARFFYNQFKENAGEIIIFSGTPACLASCLAEIGKNECGRLKISFHDTKTVVSLDSLRNANAEQEEKAVEPANRNRLFSSEQKTSEEKVETEAPDISALNLGK